MNDFESQWNALGAKHHSSGMLRVYPDHRLDFFIDYALNGNRELIIEARDIVFNFPANVYLKTFLSSLAAYQRFRSLNNLPVVGRIGADLYSVGFIFKRC